MHILGLPSFYPTSWQPQNGNFFQSHFHALRRAGHTVGVIYCEGRALRRDLSPANLAQYRFQTELRDEDGLATLRCYGWDTLTKFSAGGIIWAHLIAATTERYIRIVGRPDLLHAHQAQWGGYAAYLVSRRLEIPYIVTEHSHYYFSPELVRPAAACRRTALGHAQAVVAVSRALAEAMTPFTGGREVLIIPNPVDTDAFTPALPRSAGEPHHFLAVGRLTTEKRFDLLIDAFSRIAKELPASTLTIIGEGPEREVLECRRAWSGAAERIDLPGARPADAVRAAMQQASALVVASDIETFGVVLVEAMAVGLPVLSTMCGGPEDIVTPETGLLVPCGDADALAEGMCRLAATRFDPARIRTQAVARFSFPAVAAAYEALYRQVLALPAR